MVYKTLIHSAAAPAALVSSLLAFAVPGPSIAAEQAGVAAAVRGDVTLLASAPDAGQRVVGENLGSGDKIFLGDEISTGPDSGMQIMLLDETVFTIGPDAGLVIDEFVYDPATSAGQVTASVVKGAFRFVSGKVAKEEPSNMNVRTPVGTIGIRGTSAAGRVDPPDPATPGSTFTGTFILLGPGADNNAGERAGRILVTNGGTTVEITRSGFGTIINSPTLPPGTPVRFNPAQVASLTGGLGTDGSARPSGNNGGSGTTTQGGNNSGSGGNQSGSGQQAGTATSGPAGGPSGGSNTGGGNLGQVVNLTGQTLGQGLSDSRFLGSVGETQQQADRDTQEAAEEANTGGGLANTAIATFDQLRSVQTGTAVFNFGTVQLEYESGSLTDSGGSFDADAFIDFGARTLDLTVANIQYTFVGGQPVGAIGQQMFVFSPNNDTFDNTYNNDSGFVAKTWDSQVDTANFPTPPTDGSRATISAAILNNVDTNTIAATGVISMRIEDADSDTVIVGGATANRQ